VSSVDGDFFAEIEVGVVDRLVEQGYSDDQVAHYVALSILSTDRVPGDVVRDLAGEPGGETACRYRELRRVALLAVQGTRRRN
jgi:hypothetical protein